MPTPAQHILGYQAATRLVRDRVERFAATAWAALPSYRDRDISRLVDMIVPQVLAGQRQVAGLTDAYIAALAGRASFGIDPELVTAGAVRIGTTPEEVYRRPAVSVYSGLAGGNTVNAAVQAGGRRLLSLVGTDLQLALRAQEQISYSGYGYEFYRRVLTGRENCALCAIASTQRYRTGNLKPIHPGCDCGSAMAEAASDPGKVLNESLLVSLHDEIFAQIGARDPSARDLGIGKTDSQGRQISDYTDLIVVQQHGELGPVLAWRGDKFTGPGDLS